jgi:hypothetical protein
MGVNDDREMLDVAQATVAELDRKLVALRRIHTAEQFGDCVEDGDPYPCATIRILDRTTTRPWTPDALKPSGGTIVRVKRACSGCGQLLGDITQEEMQAAIAGDLLPDTRDECGCGAAA